MVDGTNFPFQLYDQGNITKSTIVVLQRIDVVLKIPSFNFVKNTA